MSVVGMSVTLRGGALVVRRIEPGVVAFALEIPVDYDDPGDAQEATEEHDEDFETGDLRKKHGRN
jgi:hypothetical protein